MIESSYQIGVEVDVSVSGSVSILRDWVEYSVSTQTRSRVSKQVDGARRYTKLSHEQAAGGVIQVVSGLQNPVTVHKMKR